MLARRLPTILPPLDEDEALQTSMIYSAAGKLDGASLIRRRPFRAPHQDVSIAGLDRRRQRRAEAGRDQPRAQRRALPRRAARDRSAPCSKALRQPLEERRITIVRARHAITFPAAFALVAAMNPCPCGYHGSSLRGCICEQQRGPALPCARLRAAARPYRSAGRGAAGRLPSRSPPSAPASRRPGARARAAARAIQRRRFAGSGIHANAQMGPRQLAAVVQARREVVRRISG